MISSFFGLNTAASGLFSQQRAMDIIGHNIANANTKGYSRQEGVYSAGSPFTMPGFNRIQTAMQLGTGISMNSVRRIRDGFLDWQVRNQIWQMGEWSARNDALAELEAALLDESSEFGLSGAMVRMWDSWQELTLQPESRAVRDHLISRSSLLLTTMKGLSDRILRMQLTQDSKVKATVSEINEKSQQIADLNGEIAAAVAVGYQPNDLMDRRDMLVDELSSLVDLNIQDSVNGQINVFIGGKQLVRDDAAVRLLAVPETVSTAVDGSSTLSQVLWADDGTRVNPTSGELYGILYSRDTVLTNFHTKLNELAMTMVGEINNEHLMGYGLDGTSGLQFFDGTNVRDLVIVQDILDDPNKIAAAAEDPTSLASGPGDSDNAVLISQLRFLTLHPATDLDGATYEDYFQALLTETGVSTQQAAEMSINMTYLADQFEQRRQSISGVSIDEEMVNMVKFQNAYNASARVITAMDEMLDKVINGMGLVGR